MNEPPATSRMGLLTSWLSCFASAGVCSFIALDTDGLIKVIGFVISGVSVIAGLAVGFLWYKRGRPDGANDAPTDGRPK